MATNSITIRIRQSPDLAMHVVDVDDIHDCAELPRHLYRRVHVHAQRLDTETGMLSNDKKATLTINPKHRTYRIPIININR